MRFWTKEEIITWIRKPQNLLLVLVLLFALYLRFKYFGINISQSYWFDESDYLNLGKYWAFDEPFWRPTDLRPPLFMFLLAVLFKLGLNEWMIRFFIMLVPSMLIVYGAYLLGKKLFSPAVGLIAAFITSVAWEVLFNTARVHTDILLTMFIVFGFYFALKSLDSKKNLIWMAVFFALAYDLRETGLVYLFAAAVFLLIYERLSILKSKYLWYAIGVFVLLILPYVIYGYVNFDHPAPWVKGRFGGTVTEASQMDFSLACFNMIKVHQNNTYYLFFVIGLIFILSLFLVIDKMIKDPKSLDKGMLFTLITFLVSLIIFIWMVRTCAEPRWIMGLAIISFIIAAYGINLILSKGKEFLIKQFKLEKEERIEYLKKILVAIVLVILALGAYENLKVADTNIMDKRESFNQIWQAGQYLKGVTAKDEIIYSLSTQPELQYSAERYVKGFPGKSPKEILQNIKTDKVNYLVLGFFLELNEEGQMKVNYVFQNQNIFNPVNGYPPMIGPENNIPLVTIFKINHNELEKELKKFA